MLKLEALAFFNKSAGDVVSAINEGDTKQFFKSVNAVLKVANNKTAAPKCLRVIDSVTGLPSQGIVQEKQAFRNNLSTLMGGEVGTFASLVQKDRYPPADRYNKVSEDEVAASVPTFFDLFNCYSSLVKGKACGEGLFVSDVFKLFPYHLSKLFYPLVVKLSLESNPLFNGKVV